MIFLSLLQPHIQEFITSNLERDCSEIALKKNPFPNENYTEIINQISCKQKAKVKLPTWFHSENIVFPSKISIEQTSSEAAAAYKAALVDGESLFDATGGFGIDSYYFAKKIKNVVHCETNENLSEIVKHNFSVLKSQNISCIIGDSAEILTNLNQKFDWIYLDPSRRNETKGKVFLLSDCLPNIIELQDFYHQYSNQILIKTAPFLDIQAGLLELKNVKTIHIVAIENEVKELLWELDKTFKGLPKIKTINIQKNNNQVAEFHFDRIYDANYSLPQMYLYEPNVALLKSGCFEAISETFKVNKLHQNSHLYTSLELKEFQGRRFKIDTIVPFQKAEIKKYIQNQKMNVSTRNFPLKPEEIKKKYHIKDGGTIFAFFTTVLNNEKIVLLCTKI